MEYKITKILQAVKNNNNVNLFLNDKFWVNVNKNFLVDFELHKGKTITEEEKLKIEKISSLEKMIEKLSTFFNLRPRSTLETKQHLQKKGTLDKEFIDLVVRELIDRKFLNDEYFAGWFIQNRINFKKIGINKIKQELRAKGIDDSIINAAVSKTKSEVEDFEEKELQNAKNALDKKLRIVKYKNEFEKNQKLYAFLVSKGFSSNIIKQILNSVDN